MQIVSYNDVAELDTFASAWEHLSRQEPLNLPPSFSDLRAQVSGSPFQFMVVYDGAQIKALACFRYTNGTKSYEIAARKLFSLQVRQVSLIGSCVLGRVDDQTIKQLFRRLAEGPSFDLIDVGEVFLASPLYAAARGLHSGMASWMPIRKARQWWLIRLPSSFEAYTGMLRPTAKTHILRDSKRFERQTPVFRVFYRLGDVEQFLEDAQKISRLSYQWNLGPVYSLRDDEVTRSRLNRLAEHGALRCYIYYLAGEPCAFGWGELRHRKFMFERTGYDPKHRNLSPGTALIMGMIRDLIENTDCDTFHFKWGGTDGYKSRLCTESVLCAPIQIAQTYRPYSLLIIASDCLFNATKSAAEFALERSGLAQRLRSTLRRIGVGTF
jgi:hypothetical protein